MAYSSSFGKAHMQSDIYRVLVCIKHFDDYFIRLQNMIFTILLLLLLLELGFVVVLAQAFLKVTVITEGAIIFIVFAFASSVLVYTLHDTHNSHEIIDSKLGADVVYTKKTLRRRRSSSIFHGD